MSDDPRVELLEEALADADRLLRAEDRGWSLLGDTGTWTAEQAKTVRQVARAAAMRDPLISRAVNLRVAYVWGEGAQIQPTVDGEDVPELGQTVADFLDANEATWSGAQAREELERRLATDGEAFMALPTSPLTGAVLVRAIPVDEVAEVITDPQDSATAWLYRRRWSERAITADGLATTTTTVQREALLPDVAWRPARRPRSIDGVEVLWDTPVAHVAVNRTNGRGVPDVLAALPWSRGYGEFLGDWSKLVKALSRFAFQATVKSKGGAAAMRERMSTAAIDGSAPTGQTAIMPEGAKLEAVGKSGATIDAQSGRPLAAMVAAALDIPVTMLLADPGVTGARATAETLDRPMELVFGMRREVHAQHIRTVITHVVREAIRAPRGPLKGSITRDPVTGREVVTLAGGQTWGLDVDWPDLSTDPATEVVSATSEAVAAGLMHPMTGARLVHVALGVDDMDAALALLQDKGGQYVDPSASVGSAAVDAFRRGEDPAALLSGGSEPQ